MFEDRLIMKVVRKLKAQVKTRWYYIFWGIATTSVVAGQIVVGTGYRTMAESSQQISADINLLIQTMLYRRPTGPSPADRTPRYEPMPKPSPEDYPTNQMPIIR